MKKLAQLLSFEIPAEYGLLEIENVVDDSREVKFGDMFIALSGTNVDGRKFIKDAVSKGAGFILQQSEDENTRIDRTDGVVYIFVPDIRAELVHVASKFFPSQFNNIVAVTGTNGKSSTVDMIRAILNMSHMSAASLGTLGIITGSSRRKLPGNMTSPGALLLHKILHGLDAQGVKNVALEASSHGIYQHRLDGLNFSVCAFTNLSQDHLDYHETMEKYFEAKLMLFSEVAPRESIFVVNADDEHSKKICEVAESRKIKLLTYGRSDADLKIGEIQQLPEYQQITFSFENRDYSFRLPLQGTFQAYNSACAALCCYAIGLPMENIVPILEKVPQIEGRLKLTAKIRGAQIYVDYAHTPDALKNALTSLRPITKGKLFVLFGCGGERDHSKRALMGQVASEYADVVIVTDDNPRREDPAEIRKMILSDCKGAKEIGNRKSAIEQTIDELSQGDILLIAGKGHEDYQVIGTETIHFSDREVILDKVKAEEE